MIFAGSDVSSLATSLGHWEWAEYGSCALVALGCTGEYIAEFTDVWSGGIKEKKDRPAKRSTLLLISALALELICLVKTNSISGMLIGSLSDKAEQADTKAQSAIDKSSLAEHKADTANTNSSDALLKAGKAESSLGKAENESNRAQAASSRALTLARGARQEADSFEKDIFSAKEAAAKAEAKVADRILTDAQVISIGNKLKVFNGQAYTVSAYWDSKESLGIANRIHAALHDIAKWSYSDEGSKGVMIGGIVGVLVWIHPDADANIKRAANSLVEALNAEGIAAVAKQENPKNPKSNQIGINVGANR